MKLWQKYKTLDNKYPIPAFLIKLMVFFFILDTFFTLMIGITANSGDFHSAFITKHFNLVRWFENFLLHAGGVFTMLFDYNYTIEGKSLVLDNGSSVILGYSCIGFSVMSFYAAFILAFPQEMKRKVIYFFAGLALIILLNIIRIGGLAMIYSSRMYQEVVTIDHHDIFNFVVYVIVFIIFVIFTRTENKMSGASE